MPWRKPLPKPVTHTDGRVLETLLDARSVLSQPDLVTNPAAQRALMLMIDAAEAGDPTGLEVAADQIAFVLRNHRLLF